MLYVLCMSMLETALMSGLVNVKDMYLIRCSWYVAVGNIPDSNFSGFSLWFSFEVAICDYDCDINCNLGLNKFIDFDCDFGLIVIS